MQFPISVSIQAFATTVHFALAALRNHRTPTSVAVSSLTMVSLLLSATPWLFPTVGGLVFGLGAHVLWFVVCESLVPRRLVPLARSAAAPPAPTRSAEARPAASARTALPATPRPRPAGAAPPSPAAARPKGFVRTPVLLAFDETADVKTIRVARAEGFDFEAGQFITVRVRVDGQEYARCYSISSPPDVRGYLEISVKRLGLISTALHLTARPGSMLSIRPPNGAFTYPAGDDRPIVLIAGGIGITPLMSMLRHAIHVEPMRPVTLVYGARTAQDFAFHDELATIARRHPQARVVLAAADGAVPGMFPGHIDARLLEVAAPDITHAVTYVCGPPPMLAAMKPLLAGLGVPPAQIRHEVFQPAVAASGFGDIGAPDHSVSTAPTLELRSARSGRAVPIAPGRTLLEAAEAGGIDIPSLCRAGVCGTCRTQVIDGIVDCDSITLDDDDRAQGFVLACVATARTTCTVDA